MNALSKNTLTIIIIIFSVAVIFGIKYYRDTAAQNTVSHLARVKGNEDAFIRITEFIDFQCPACAAGAKYLKEIMEKHPQAIRLELKHYPLNMHKHAFLASRYAECAAKQNAFWGMHDHLIDRQNLWKRLHDPKPAFDQIIKELNLNTNRLDQCLEDESITQLIQNHKEEGSAKGVRSTPSYFVNGKMVVGTQSLKSEIEQLINEAAN